MSNLKFTDKINELLAENASIWANLGTGTFVPTAERVKQTNVGKKS